MTNQEHKLEGPSGFVPLIAIWNIAIWPDFGKWRVQEGVIGLGFTQFDDGKGRATDLQRGEVVFRLFAYFFI